ncbi:hypothetical protein [Streptomyces sp. NPDC057302]|uniref:hypothetical protein n=1 Tax=Streptomyces sp. NPDC057302 TaxID=3346094 RepID=UPI00363EEBE8
MTRHSGTSPSDSKRWAPPSGYPTPPPPMTYQLHRLELAGAVVRATGTGWRDCRLG